MPPWAGISCRCNQPGPVTAGNITGFIRSYTSLLFLVALPDDAAARVLMEEGNPGPGSRIPVPLVLMEDRSKNRPRAQSAA